MNRGVALSVRLEQKTLTNGTVDRPVGAVLELPKGRYGLYEQYLTNRRIRGPDIQNDRIYEPLGIVAHAGEPSQGTIDVACNSHVTFREHSQHVSECWA